MKMFVFLVFAIFAASASGEQYTSKFDNVDIDEILSSDRLLKNYFNCVMDKGPCTPDGTELKKTLPDALQTGCEKCTDKQREGAKKIIGFLNEKKKDMFEQLEAKYDPQGVYWEKFKSTLDN